MNNCSIATPSLVDIFLSKDVSTIIGWLIKKEPQNTCKIIFHAHFMFNKVFHKEDFLCIHTYGGREEHSDLQEILVCYKEDILHNAYYIEMVQKDEPILSKDYIKYIHSPHKANLWIRNIQKDISQVTFVQKVDNWWEIA